MVKVIIILLVFMNMYAKEYKNELLKNINSIKKNLTQKSP